MVLLEYLLRYLTLLPFGYWLCIIGVSAALSFCLNLTISHQYRHQKIFATILLGYALYIIFSAVIVRSPGIKSGIELNPFWAYDKIIHGEYFWPEIVGNILLGVPIGFMAMPIMTVLTDKRIWHVVLSAGLGLLISILIEILQFLTEKGLADIGDVFHNTLGALVGALAYALIVYLIRRNKVRTL